MCRWWGQQHHLLCRYQSHPLWLGLAVGQQGWQHGMVVCWWVYYCQDDNAIILYGMGSLSVCMCHWGWGVQAEMQGWAAPCCVPYRALMTTPLSSLSSMMRAWGHGGSCWHFLVSKGCGLGNLLGSHSAVGSSTPPLSLHPLPWPSFHPLLQVPCPGKQQTKWKSVSVWWKRICSWAGRHDSAKMVPKKGITFKGDQSVGGSSKTLYSFLCSISQ